MISAFAHRSIFCELVQVVYCRAAFHTGTQIYRTSIGLDSPAFQQHLRQLKLRLHPDRVAAHPDARAANEQSFKVLSQYLEELRGDGGNPAEQYRLDFYVKRACDEPPDWQDLTVNESMMHASSRIMRDPRSWKPGKEIYKPPTKPIQQMTGHMAVQVADGLEPMTNNEFDTAASPLRRFTIRLPPPPPHAASRLPEAVRRAFRRLFAALQFEDIFVEDDISIADHTQRELTAEALTNFLPDAIELARQGEAVHHGLPSQQLQSMCSAFWLSRHMRIVFDGTADMQPLLTRITQLEALACAIDGSENAALRDCTVLIGEGVGLDVLGRVWLPFDWEEMWPEVLRAVDVTLVWERKEHFERVRKLEASAAASFGIAAVFSSHRLSLSASYLDFLQGLEAYGARLGPVCGGDVAPLSLCAAPAVDMPQMTLLPDTGVVRASVGCSADEIAAFMAAHGVAVADALQRRRVVEKGLLDLRRRVELRLRLRQLRRGTAVTSVQFERGCHRLLEHQEFLSKYLEGSVVELSEQNCITPGQHIICIAWDFHL
eukprot:jgi/Ulvmu1/2743/UM014_0200.1